MKLRKPRLYRVKRGQKIADVARAFGVPISVLCKQNGLTQEIRTGQVLCIPEQQGNLYRVQGGESKTLLCGSAEQFERLNQTKFFYPEQEIWI